MRLPSISGELIRVRRLKRQDIHSLQNNANDENISKFIPFIPHPYTLNNARKWINLTHRMARSNNAYHFGITLIETNEIIGMIGLKNINLLDLNAEIEYWVGSKYWKRGIASEALNLILKFAFNDLNLVRVYAFVPEKNIASIRLLDKFRFTKEGIFRKVYRADNEWNNVFGYGILNDEFEGIE